MKKFLIRAAVIAAVLFIAVGILVNNWADTGHGKLDYRVAVILKLMTLAGDDSAREVSESTVAQNRKQLEGTSAKFAGKPTPLPSIIDRAIPGPGGEIPIRIYTPVENKVLPVTIYFHGGGWVQGGIKSHDSPVRYLAAKSGTIMVSVDYRLAPENPFPAAVEDAYAALEWVAKNADTFSGNPQKIALAGDSAGGNLAAVVSLIARDKNGPKITRQVLIYPATNLATLDTDSHKFFASGYMLTHDDIVWFRGHYLPNTADWPNPHASPLLAQSHASLPPATIITAEMDPLRDEGKQYADKLQAANIPVNYHCYKGMIHGFTGGGKVLPQALLALDEIAADLRGGFGM